MAGQMNFKTSYTSLTGYFSSFNNKTTKPLSGIVGFAHESIFSVQLC